MNPVLSAPLRLAALQESGLLTGRLSDKLAKVAESACTLLKSDAAQVNVLDAEQQKTVGQFPPDFADTVYMPVLESACQIPLRVGETVIIPDARDHPIVCDMPWVGKILGYMGTPVYFHGQAVGVLCALDVKPRDWTTKDRQTLEGLAWLTSLAIEGTDA